MSRSPLNQAALTCKRLSCLWFAPPAAPFPRTLGKGNERSSETFVIIEIEEEGRCLPARNEEGEARRRERGALEEVPFCDLSLKPSFEGNGIVVRIPSED